MDAAMSQHIHELIDGFRPLNEQERAAVSALLRPALQAQKKKRAATRVARALPLSELEERPSAATRVAAG